MKLARLQYVFFLVLFGAVLARAQDNKPKKTGEIEDAEVIIEKNRAITLPEADRNYEKIPASAAKSAPALRPYGFEEINPALTDLNPKLRVLQMPGETAAEQYGNYVRAGLATYAGLYGEGYFNSTRNKTFAYGARLRHLSFRQGPVDGGNSATNENFIGLHGKYAGDALTASGALEYSRRRYYFYGYRPGTFERTNDDRRKIRQVFNTIGFKTSFANAVSGADLDYKLDLNVYNLTDHYDAGEFEFSTNVNATYAVSDALSGLLTTDLYLTRVSDRGAVSRNLFRLKPRLQYRNGDNLTLSGGISIVYQNDTLSNAPALNLYPVLEAQYAVTEGLTLFAGFEGDMQRTSLRQFTNENPWLVPNVPLVHTNKLRDLYAGVKGKAGSDLSFAVRLAYLGYRNLYFYTNSALDTAKFTLLYDPDYTNVVNFSGELAYSAAEKFRLTAKVDYYSYNPKNVREAWHRPNMTASVLGKYNLNPKLSFNTEIYYLGGITATKAYAAGGVARASSVNDRETDLQPVVDVNIKADYALSNRFSAFLSLNNLLNSKYERFLYYPSRGLTLMLGATYSF